MKEPLSSKDEANEAVLEQGNALRLQPPAPNPTEYYYTENGKWKKHVSGHKHNTTVDVEYVREKVSYGLGKNNSDGVDCLHAVDMERVTEYA